MWKAIKWGFGIMLGIALAYVLFWIVAVVGIVAILAGGA